MRTPTGKPNLWITSLSSTNRSQNGREGIHCGGKSLLRLPDYSRWCGFKRPVEAPERCNHWRYVKDVPGNTQIAMNRLQELFTKCSTAATSQPNLSY